MGARGGQSSQQLSCDEEQKQTDLRVVSRGRCHRFGVFISVFTSTVHQQADADRGKWFVTLRDVLAIEDCLEKLDVSSTVGGGTKKDFAANYQSQALN